MDIKECISTIILLFVFMLSIQSYAQDIRLIGGVDQLEGRVEVYIDNEWGTICDDFWDLNDAIVVCRQLGFKGASLAAGEARYGAGQGPIHLDDVRCSSTEAFITQCTHVSNTDCRHQEDARVRCISYDIYMQVMLLCKTDTGDVRLTDGNETAGRVQIYFDGTWRRVCDENWTPNEAVITCRQLGFGKAFSNTADLSYDGRQQSVSTIEMFCYGNETIVLDCPLVAIKDCSYNKYAGVSCHGLPHGQSDVRLSSGNETAGRMEVYLDNEWGTVCNDRFDIIDADVVCRQLGFQGAFNVLSSETYGGGEGPVHFDEVACHGNETSLWECAYSRKHDCTHREDVGISCAPFETGSIRLSDGNETFGRVDIFLSNEWVSICFESWDKHDAAVVCRQLGFRTVVNATKYSQVEELNTLNLADVRCEGVESMLRDCPHQINQTCSLNVYAGVHCVPFVNGHIRLANGNQTAGRVEVFYNGQWGTICDDNWDITDARIVCNQLGFKTAYQAISRAEFGLGHGPVHFDEVACQGNELSLISCPKSDNPDCGHQEDAGVSCKTFKETLPEIGDVRLVGQSVTNGRIEMYLSKKWRSICFSGWDLNDATTVCRQLGFKSARNANDYASRKNQDTLYLSDFKCDGTESLLISCPHATNISCSMNTFAGAHCIPYVNGDLRLVNGNRTAGRVEVFYHDEWGTVCDDDWDINDAHVVCTQLGFNKANQALGGASFGLGSGPIHFDDVACFGHEFTLIECPRSDNLANCGHKEDAGVSCKLFEEGIWGYCC